MATSQKYTGEDMVLLFKGTNISGEGRTLEIDESVEEIDVTTYGSDDREYLVTKKRMRTATFTVLDTAGASAVENLVDPGASGTLEYAPEGTATGKRKRTVTALVLRSRKSYPHDQVVQFNTDLRLSGSVTKSVY